MRGKPRSKVLAYGMLSTIFATGTAVSQTLNDVITTEQTRIRQAQQSQDQIDGVVEETRSRVDEYRAVMREVDGLVVYNTLLERQIADQEQELEDLRNSIDQVTVIERQILPLLTRMVEGLRRFVELDVPFLAEERTDRVAELEALLGRSDVTAAAKFRRVMESWQIENDYGRTIEAYTGELQIDGQNREVSFLRIGRVALIYQTPDGSQAGAWDQRDRQWVSLGGGYRNSVTQALRMARDQIAPDLVLLPIAPPEEG